MSTLISRTTVVEHARTDGRLVAPPKPNGPAAAGFAGICHVAAGALLLKRRRDRPDVVRWTPQHFAIMSLAPIFLLGAAMAIESVPRIHPGSDPLGIGFGIGISVVAGIFAMIALVAVRIVRAAARLTSA